MARLPTSSRHRTQPGSGSAPLRGVSVRTPIDWLACLHLMLLFFPYLAVPIGASSNLPAWVLSGLVLIVQRHRRGVLTPLVAILAVGPAAASFVTLLAQSPPITGLVAWVAYLSGYPAAVALAASAPRAQLRRALQALLVAASTYAVVQYLAMGNGTVLRWFVSRDLQGYANLAAQSDLQIAVYEHRAFGWFPEPSFLAGSLLLGALALLVIEGSDKRPDRLTIAAVAAVCVAVVLARSGSALLGLPAVVGLLVMRLHSPLVRVGTVALGAVVIWHQLGELVAYRTVSTDSSWSDRISSVLELLEVQTQHLSTTIFGLGRGASASLINSGQVNVGDAAGVAGILSRSVVEQGFLFGLVPLLAWLIVSIRDGARVTGLGAAVVGMATWTFLGCFVLGYETTGMFWALPGLMSGLALREATSMTEPAAQVHAVAAPEAPHSGPVAMRVTRS